MILGPVLAAVVAVVGWWIGHLLNTRRDLRAKRRDIRVQYLIEAYRRIESVASRVLGDPEDDDAYRRARSVEDAIGDIQLFGDQEQVRLAAAAARSLAEPGGTADFGPLLQSLRDDLRCELQLTPVDATPVHLRIRPK